MEGVPLETDRHTPKIIVFARAPLPGKTKTRLIPALGADGAAALSHAFNLDALRKVTLLGYPAVIAGSGPVHYFLELTRQYPAEVVDQGEGDLGERMLRVLSQCGAESKILIGTDTPSLPLVYLRDAEHLLRSTRVVLGPSHDGGYYLIGIRGSVPNVFSGVEWGTSSVLKQTVERLQAQGLPFALGHTWYDVDDESDLKRLIADLRILRQRQLDFKRASPGKGSEICEELHPCPQTQSVLEQLNLIR